VPSAHAKAWAPAFPTPRPARDPRALVRSNGAMTLDVTAVGASGRGAGGALGVFSWQGKYSELVWRRFHYRKVRFAWDSPLNTVPSRVVYVFVIQTPPFIDSQSTNNRSRHSHARLRARPRAAA
jgi:hypothetical protein